MLVVLFAVLVTIGGPAREGFEAKLAVLERTMDRHYRGERLDDAVVRSNREIAAYNLRAKELQSKSELERIRMERLMEPLKEGRGRLDALDKELRNPPVEWDFRTRQRKVEERNALVQKLNREGAMVRSAVEAYNALARRTQEEIEAERIRVEASQNAVNARLEAFAEFTKAGLDAGFFIELTQLLAEVRRELRASPGNPELERLLAKVRGLRRELATWAKVGQDRKANGLVIVETLVADEPCWFIVDTGAMDTIVSEEILDAIGLGDRLGKQTSLSVVGGLRITGFACILPRLQVAGESLADVPAAATRPSDAGIDGLLGQTFLKKFVYTIDERQPGRLILVRR